MAPFPGTERRPAILEVQTLFQEPSRSAAAFDGGDQAQADTGVSTGGLDQDVALERRGVCPLSEPSAQKRPVPEPRIGVVLLVFNKMRVVQNSGLLKESFLSTTMKGVYMFEKCSCKQNPGGISTHLALDGGIE